jgi:hypothetical protein
MDLLGSIDAFSCQQHQCRLRCISPSRNSLISPMARVRLAESLNQAIKRYSEGKDTQGNQPASSAVSGGRTAFGLYVCLTS